MGSNFRGGVSRVRLNGSVASDTYFAASSEPPFIRYTEATGTAATPTSDVKEANVVRFEGVSGSSFTVALGRVASSDRTGILAVQLVDTARDADLDGNADAWEILHGLDPSVNDAAEDPDGDGLSNRCGGAWPERNPLKADTDDDGLSDSEETTYGTSALNADHDDDGLYDGDEVNGWPFKTDPNNSDSDSDGSDDGQEVAADTDPNDTTIQEGHLTVPTYNAASRTWSWTVDNVRALWNHDLQPMSASPWDEQFPFGSPSVASSARHHVLFPPTLDGLSLPERKPHLSLGLSSQCICYWLVATIFTTVIGLTCPPIVRARSA